MRTLRLGWFYISVFTRVVVYSLANFFSSAEQNKESNETQARFMTVFNLPERRHHISTEAWVTDWIRECVEMFDL